MNNIYLLYNYNNYYNRQVKRETTLAAYLNAVGAQGYINFDNVINFNPADGVSTKHLFNMSLINMDINQKCPDYMLLVDDTNAILQRWFVIEMTRTRGGQYELTLYRDTVAEAWNEIQNAPIFVEKAILQQTDPMIFNSENMTFNQIKKSETLLKDFTEVPWIVGYITQSQLDETEYSFDPDVLADPYTTKEDYAYNTYVTNNFSYAISADDYELNVEKLATAREDLIRFSKVVYQYTQNSGFNSGAPYIADESRGLSFAENCKNGYASIETAMKSTYGIHTEAEKAAFMNQQDKIIYITSEQKYYKVNIKTIYTPYSNVVPEIASAEFIAMQQLVINSNNGFLSNTSINPGSFRYTCTIINRKIEYQQITPNTINYTIPHTRRKLSDQPYTMFAMPYGYCKIIGFDGPTEQHWENVTMKVAENISHELGGESPALYDLQLLPYFPMQELRNHSGNITIANCVEDRDYSYIKQNNTNVGIIFWATQSKGSFDIFRPITVTNNKIDNETKMYRLCSPNFAGSFDFSAAKNGGVTKFNVDFTYKPYNPYIHINPNFGNLYGEDFDDARGLICEGKFDLPQTTNAWANYERTNSNYNNIFNRQIQNLEIQNKYGKTSDIVSAIAGGFQGAGAGAAMGSAFGGIGAGIGAAAGGAISMAAGIADVSINEKLRQENMSLTKDMYGYQLGNIKALPDSLASVGAFTNNNKVFPFLETYECTQEETNALKNKIKYNGMSVGRIGYISEFKDNRWENKTYFKGQLIQATVTNEDWHFINTLKTELNMGIFIEEV